MTHGYYFQLNSLLLLLLLLLLQPCRPQQLRHMARTATNIVATPPGRSSLKPP